MGWVASLTAYLLLANVPAYSNPISDVRVQFYMLQLNQWIDLGLEAKFKSTLALGLLGFCSANFTACGANASVVLNFTASSVHFTPGYPKNADSRYMNLRLYISYNLLGDSDAFNLAAVDTATILEDNRLQLHEQVGFYIVYIGDKFFSIPPPHMTNIIVVSASCGFTALLIIFAMTLRACYPEDTKELLKSSSRKLEANRRRRLQDGLLDGHAGPTTASTAASAGSAEDAVPAVDADEAGRMNPGFSGSPSPNRAEDSQSQLSDSASPVLSPTDDEAAPEAGGGRLRRLGKEAAAVGSSEQILLSEAVHAKKNGSLHGNGTAKSNEDNKY